MVHTLDEWKEIYKKKTGVEYEDEEGFILYYLPNRGFCQYAVNPQTKHLAVNHCCGDGEFWADLGIIMAKQQNLAAVDTLVCRNPRAYFRAMKWKVEYEQALPNGRVNFFGVDELGKPVSMQYGWINDDTGRDLYITSRGV